MKHEQQSIAWHPAFIEAIKMELEEYRDFLEFFPEYQLASEPLRIDCLVIKKAKDVVVKKNIAAIFREVNLLEYKSPEDYVSTADFYKVYGYACLYASISKEVAVSGITISFVESRHPKKLLKHLREFRKYTVEESSPGIYTVIGDIFPIQIIDSRKLSSEENLWLKDLDNRLGVDEMVHLLGESRRRGNAARIGAYLDVVIRANHSILEEVVNMSSKTPTMEEILERTGLAAKLEARAEARGEARGEAKARKDFLGLLSQGLSAEEIKQRLEEKTP